MTTTKFDNIVRGFDRGFERTFANSLLVSLLRSTSADGVGMSTEISKSISAI